MLDVFPVTAAISDEGRLSIGGCEVTDVVHRHGTPVIVFDRETFEARASAFAAALSPERVYYAGKSLCCVAICELLDGLGLGMDVCTGGELATALRAGFPAERLLFHGNNKSVGELEMASEAGVGRIVADSFDELDRLAKVGTAARLLVRITPGVEAHTHEFVQTGQEDSKFGFGLGSGVAFDAVERALKVGELVGFHAHIGSQIFELAAFELAIKRLATFAAEVRDRSGYSPSELNLGGGFGIAHTEDESTPDIAGAVARITGAVEREFTERDMAVPDVSIEPGRAIVGPSAVTVYEVGTVKTIPGVRTYVAVDGGMSDNIRPALYGARYQAHLANRMTAEPGPHVTICGKHCESGDILIKDVHLPADVGPGDLVVVPATGAYTYSMASNYNRIARPPIVMVEGGRDTVIVQRETVDDLLRFDRRVDGSAPGDPVSGRTL